MTDASPRRRHFSSGGPYEARFGYSRALRTGDRVLVSGCTSMVDGQVRHPGDAAAQMRVALDTAIEAVTSLGGSAGDVVRTRVFLTDRVHAPEAMRAHGEAFADVRPACTAVVCALLDERWLCELEVEAVLR